MAGPTYYDSGSLVIGSLEEYRTYVAQRVKELFGESMRTNPGSVWGQHIDLQSELLSDSASILGYVSAQSNPDSANGASLHESVQFNGITVNPNVYSTVTVTCGAGPEGSTIPAGRQFSNGSGTVFALDSETIVPPNDTLSAPATAVEEGAIEAEADTLTTIDQPIYGWLSVTNPQAAIIGNRIESDPALKSRRRDAASGVGGGSTSYVETRVRNIDNVTDAAVTITQQKHAQVVVEGGTDEDIAETLHKAVGGGTVYDGTTTVAYTDADTGQNDSISFYRAVQVPIYVTLQIERRDGYENAGGDELIKQRTIEYFTGELEVEGTFVPKPRLGETLTVAKTSLGPDTVDRCIVRRVFTGFDPGPTSAEDLSMNIWQRPSTSETLIVIEEYTG